MAFMSVAWGLYEKNKDNSRQLHDENCAGKYSNDAGEILSMCRHRPLPSKSPVLPSTVMSSSPGIERGKQDATKYGVSSKRGSFKN